MRKALGTILPLALIGLGVYYYQSAKNFANTLLVKFKGAKFNQDLTKGSFFLKVWFDVSLDIINPSNFSATVNGINLLVYYNNTAIARIAKTDQITIEANHTTPLTFQMGVPVQSIFSNVGSAVTAIAAHQKIYIDVKGTVLTNSGTINVNERIPIA